MGYSVKVETRKVIPMSNQPAKTLDDLLDDVLEQNGIEVDQNSDEPVVFEYTDAVVKEMIVSGRVRMLIKHPFFGTLATRLKLVETEGWCPTAAVDGKHFYYNPNFFRTLTPEEIDFVVGHEVLHCVYSHCGEGGRLFDYAESDRDPKLWNIAADYKVNQGCVESNIGKMPKSALFDRKYHGMYTEEIYQKLKETGEGKGKETLDMHLFGDEGTDGDGQDGKMQNDPTGRKGPIKVTKEEAKAIKDQMRQAVLQAAQSAGAGNTPGEIRRLIQSMTEPKMDWRELLNLSVQSCLKNDYTWMRQSKKSRSMGIYLPAQDPDQMVDVCIGLDVSGSISHDMLQDFMGEIQGIMTQFQDFRLRVWTFDTRVYEESFKEFTPMNADEINDYEIIGCGGTDFVCNWTFMEENDIQPQKFVMFTDGYPYGSWGDENYCDTLFVIHGNDRIVPPFGEHAYYAK
jgi:predicted metal-dependent peptidase